MTKKNQAPAIAMPVQLGMKNGYNANLITDANGDAILLAYGIPNSTRVETVREDKDTRRVEAVARADFATAINSHASLMEAGQLAIKHMLYSQDSEVAKAIEKMHSPLKLASAA